MVLGVRYTGQIEKDGRTRDGTSASLRDSEFLEFRSVGALHRYGLPENAGPGQEQCEIRTQHGRGEGQAEEDSRPDAGPHEEFTELCAVSDFGKPDRRGEKEAERTFGDVRECQKVAKEFQDVADNAIPALAEELAPETHS